MNGAHRRRRSSHILTISRTTILASAQAAASPCELGISALNSHVYNSDDVFDWVQLEDGGWVAAHLPGI